MPAGIDLATDRSVMAEIQVKRKIIEHIDSSSTNEILLSNQLESMVEICFSAVKGGEGSVGNCWTWTKYSSKIGSNSKAESSDHEINLKERERERKKEDIITTKKKKWNMISGNLKESQRILLNFENPMRISSGSERAVSVQFQSNLRAVSGEICCVFRATSEQFQSNFSAVSEQLQCSLRGNLLRFQRNFRASSEQFQSDFKTVSVHYHYRLWPGERKKEGKKEIKKVAKRERKAKGNRVVVRDMLSGGRSKKEERREGGREGGKGRFAVFPIRMAFPAGMRT